MHHIEKRGDRYRTRLSDPTGQQHSRTFARKADAQRFLRELDADMLRGSWVDPREADTPVADCAEEFLSLCRRLASRSAARPGSPADIALTVAGRRVAHA